MLARITLHQLGFSFSNHDILFKSLNLNFSKRKIGLVGRNGVGKSTLLKLIVGELIPDEGTIHVKGKMSYVPQAPLLSSFISMNEDWEIDAHLKKQLARFGLTSISFMQPANELSGGEITRLLLAKAFSSNPDFLILDEPTNHLDANARQMLYEAIRSWHEGLIVVSHDRSLLNLMDEIVELTTLGATSYGGNYDDYLRQKNLESSAKLQQLQDAKKAIQKTKVSIQTSREKHAKKTAYGKKLRRSGSINKMTADAQKSRSEKTQNKSLIKEERMLKQAETKLTLAKEKIEIYEEIHVSLPKTHVPRGKMILNIEALSFSYPGMDTALIHDLNLRIDGPEHLALLGDNGSGKTTLVKLILGQMALQQGKITLGTSRISYLDQDASLLDAESTVVENFLRLNQEASENDAYRCLAQFLFKNTAAQNYVKNLSGGEKIRALLACVLMSPEPPQLLILDEPTNHLDLGSIKSVESALKKFEGAMIIISHDHAFLSQFTDRNFKI